MRTNSFAWLALTFLSIAACGGRGEGEMDPFGDSYIVVDPPVDADLADSATENDGAGSDADNGAPGDAGSDASGDVGSGADNPLSAGDIPDCGGSCSGCDPELGICYIRRQGDRTCTQAELTCPEGWACVVLCEGRRSTSVNRN